MTDTDADVWEGAAAAAWSERWRVPAVRLLTRTGSTNDVARTLAAGGAPAGTVVIADEQTAGRGRFGRRWIAPPGCALLVSILLRPGRTAEHRRTPSVAPIRVGLAAAEALERVTGVAAALKWPNDVVVPGHGKIAGILCEAAAEPAGDGWVVAGIGINTGQSPDELPADAAAGAASIRTISGRPGDRPAIAAALIDALRPFDLRDLQPLLDGELADYRTRDVLHGREVDVDGTRGTADGLEPDGALRLRTRRGIEIVRSGSVTPVAFPGEERQREPGPVGNAQRQPESRA